MSRVVLFVCTGNVCRSPMAAALFNAHAQRTGEGQQFIARSMGTWALENQPASGHALSVMSERGIDLSAHRARTVTRDALAEADVIIVMTHSHRDALAAEFPAIRRKLHLMSELGGRPHDIADPYGSSISEYRSCAQELGQLVEKGYDRIKAWALSPNQ